MIDEPASDRDLSKEQFLYPLSSYHGKFTPQNLAFNANLQEFAQRVSYICGLESGGKITSAQAYKEIKLLWRQLKQSKKALLDEANGEEPPAS